MLTPPKFPGEEAFKEAEKKYQEWSGTTEGKIAGELSRRQQMLCELTGQGMSGSMAALTAKHLNEELEAMKK